MAEYQNTVVSSGEVTQRFIEFVLMQAQSAAFMLGQIPHPQTGKPETNLEMAKLLIDQLVMIQEKTKGNLNSDETRILGGTISNLQLSYVEAVRGHSPAKEAAGSPSANIPSPAPAVEPQPAPEAGETDHKKKFVKSYGS
jgi:Domain of unknown function (DUF1844)